MIILIDTNEQIPFFTTQIGNPEFKKLKFELLWLKTGDYSIKGMHTPDCEHSVTIERKSLSDLFLSCGNGRVNLQKEFERMSEFDHSEIVIEADLRAFFTTPPDLSDMLPKSVYRTLIAWSQRYGVHVWACPGRTFAEKHTYISLLRFWEDRQKKGKMEFSKI